MAIINEQGQIIEVTVGDDFINKMFDLKIYLKDYGAAAQIGLLAELMNNSELINLFQNLPPSDEGPSPIECFFDQFQKLR